MFPISIGWLRRVLEPHPGQKEKPRGSRGRSHNPLGALGGLHRAGDPNPTGFATGRSRQRVRPEGLAPAPGTSYRPAGLWSPLQRADREGSPPMKRPVRSAFRPRPDCGSEDLRLGRTRISGEPSRSVSRPIWCVSGLPLRRGREGKPSPEGAQAESPICFRDLRPAPYRRLRRRYLPPVASAPGGQSAAPGGAAEHGRRLPHTAASGGGTFLLSLTLQEDKVHKGETPRELWPRPQPSRGSRCRLPGKAGPRRGDSSPEPKPLRRATGVPPDHEAEK